MKCRQCKGLLRWLEEAWESLILLSFYMLPLLLTPFRCASTELCLLRSVRNADQHSILQTYPLPLLHQYRHVCIYIYSKEMTPKYWVHQKVHSGFSLCFIVKPEPAFWPTPKNFAWNPVILSCL